MAKKDFHEVKINTSTTSITYTEDMKAGQYAEIIATNHRETSTCQLGRIIGRIWAPKGEPPNFFALDNPMSTWNTPKFKVRILSPGETIHITVGEGNPQ